MSRRTRTVSIAPHTEYTRTHTQCRRCGNTVPSRVVESEGLCPRCREVV